MKKLCERCSDNAVRHHISEPPDRPPPKIREARKGERFCEFHRKELLKEMTWSGYLQEVPDGSDKHDGETGPEGAEAARLRRYIEDYGELPIVTTF